MVKWTLSRVDNEKNSDMVHIWDDRGMIQGVMHIDSFWFSRRDQGEIYEKLKAGQEVKVGIVPAHLGEANYL